jgi:hypothetical protein
MKQEYTIFNNQTLSYSCEIFDHSLKQLEDETESIRSVETQEGRVILTCVNYTSGLPRKNSSKLVCLTFGKRATSTGS